MKVIDNIKKLWQNFTGKKILSHRLLWAVLFFVILISLLTYDLFPSGIQLVQGDVSQDNIYAPRTENIVDHQKTAELRQQAIESARKVFEQDTSVNEEIISNIEEAFIVISDKKEEYNNSEDIIREIQEEIEIDIGSSSLKTLLTIDEDVFSEFKNNVIAIMSEQLAAKIEEEELPEVRETLNQKAMDMNYQTELTVVAAEIMENNIRANTFLDQEATERNQQQALEEVEPQMETVLEGEIIVREGEVITEEQVRILEALGIQRIEVDYTGIAGIILLILVLLSLMCFYLYKHEKEIWYNNKKLVLLELLIIIIVSIAVIINIFENGFIFYLVPVAAASILIAILLNTRIAIITSIFLSFVVALVFEVSFIITFTAFCSAMVGVFSVSKLSQRSDLVKAGFNVSAAMVVMVIGFTLLDNGPEWRNFVKPITIAILNGFLVGVLANGLLPLLENMFGLTSSIKLLELSNASHPLLKKLLVEAPGSYHHSVIVGNLAETAADNIGADSLLTRVAAYYHDIGKLKRPYFFTDNQFGGKNPHDNISPNLSALIIKSHVKDGVELARKHSLPDPVIDIIKQHHGTNLIRYFYNQAISKNNQNDKIEEAKFVYDGPKPQSKEAAIIMLADIVEAALRSKQFDKSDHNRIEVMVKDLIKDRLINNQLDESDLTLKDLDIIGNSFVKVLTGIYHQRVEYPENLLNEAKKDDNNDQS